MLLRQGWLNASRVEWLVTIGPLTRVLVEIVCVRVELLLDELILAQTTVLLHLTLCV